MNRSFEIPEDAKAEIMARYDAASPAMQRIITMEFATLALQYRLVTMGDQNAMDAVLQAWDGMKIFFEEDFPNGQTNHVAPIYALAFTRMRDAIKAIEPRIVK